jgi:AraC-like DNA-binding protein
MVERRNRPAYHQLPERGICVFESHHSTTFTMPPEQRAFHKICWVAVGHGAFEHGQMKAPVGRDELLFIPQGLVHRFVDDHAAPMTLVMAYFSEEKVASQSSLAAVLPALRERFGGQIPLVKLNSYRRCGVRDIFKRMLAEQNRTDTASTATLHAGVLELLVHLLRAEPADKATAPSREQAVEGAMEYIDEMFQSPIRVKDLADMCGISSRRYSDLFKQRTGKTVIKYLNDKRIAYAQERLRESGQIMYAAIAAGFTQPTHFYRIFKKSTGMTPGQYLESFLKTQQQGDLSFERGGERVPTNFEAL